MTTIYIAGPMTGLPEYNSSAFHAAAEPWGQPAAQPAADVWGAPAANYNDEMPF